MRIRQNANTKVKIAWLNKFLKEQVSGKQIKGLIQKMD